MKIGKYELRKMTEEELNAEVETEGEEKVEKKRIVKKILLGALGVAAAAGGIVALVARGKNQDDECDLDSLPEAEDYTDVEYTEVESEDETNE